MNHEGVPTLGELVEEAAEAEQQAHALAVRLDAAVAAWHAEPGAAAVAVRRGLAAVRTIAYLALRSAQEAAEVAFQAALVWQVAVRLQRAAAEAQAQAAGEGEGGGGGGPSWEALCGALEEPCTRAWVVSLTTQATLEEEDRDAVDEECSEMVKGEILKEELWEGDWSVVQTTLRSLSLLAAFVLADSLKRCVAVKDVYEEVYILQGEVNRELTAAGASACSGPCGAAWAAREASALAGAAGMAGGNARRLLEEAWRAAALGHAALDGLGAPGEPGDHAHASGAED